MWTKSTITDYSKPGDGARHPPKHSTNHKPTSERSKWANLHSDFADPWNKLELELKSGNPK